MAEVPHDAQAEGMRKEHQSADALGPKSTSQYIPVQSPEKTSTDGSVTMAEVPQHAKAEGVRKEHQSADALGPTSTSQYIPTQSPGKTSTDGSVMTEGGVFQPEKSNCMRKESSQCADNNQLACTSTSQELQAELTVSANSAKETSVEFKKSKHKTSFDPKWLEEFPWMKHETDEGRDTLLCTLCTEIHKYSNFKNSPWINKGAQTIRLDKIKLHQKSDMHNLAVAAKTNELNNKKKNEEEFEENSEVFSAVEAAMKCINFLIQHNLPLTTLYGPLIEFCTNELQSPVLAPLNKAKNASYKSYVTINEFLDSMAKDKEEAIIEEINASPYFSVLTDETTDINNRQHMAVAIKYLKGARPNIAFLKDCHIQDGKAETIHSQLVPLIETCGSFKKLSGFTSDGARSMIGKNQGVATKLKEKQKSLIGIHCLNHKIALATKDSFESLSRFVKLDEVLTGIYKYYKNSSSRTNRLMNTQSVFGKGEGTTLKRVGYTRWLSHSNAINSIRINYKSILIDLENTVAEGESARISGPSANGLLKIFKSAQFFKLIHFMCDVLAVLTNLNLIFQKKDVDLSAIEPNFENTLSQLKKLKHKPGGTFCKKLDKEAGKLGIEFPFDDDNEYNKDVRLFIDYLISNLEKRMENESVISQLGILNLSRIGSENLISLYGNKEISELSEFFDMDEDDLLEEWDEFKNIFLSKSDIDKNELTIPKLYSLLHDMKNIIGCKFPLIEKILQISCTLAVSNAEVERIFSQVKLILNDKRNRLKIDNVHKILMIKMNPDINFKDSVNRWKSAKCRRLF